MIDRSPRAIWHIEGDADFNRIYVALGYPEPTLMCLNKGGEVLWEAITKNQVNLIASSRPFKKIFTYKVGKRGPSALSCMDMDGKELWSKNLDAKISSMHASKYSDLCILGTSDSRLLIYSGDGRLLFTYKLEAWKNPIHAFVHKQNVIAISERGLMYVFKIGGKMPRMIRKADLHSKIFLAKITSEYSCLVDFCSPRKNILHVFDHGDESYADITFEAGIRKVLPLEHGIGGVVDSTVLFRLDDSFHLEWALDIKERIMTLASDRFGENILVGTDRFNLYMIDSKGRLSWVKNTGSRKVTISEVEKGFSLRNKEDILGAELDMDCKPRDVLIETMEKCILASTGTDTKREEQEEEWLDDSAAAKRSSIIKDFKPFAVEKKLVVKSNLASQKGLPILLIQVENTTDHPIRDIRIYTDIDKDIFYVKKSLIEYDLIQKNTLKKFAVRFIPTSTEGRVKGECKMTYVSGEQEIDLFLKRFTLNNVWPNMAPLDIGKKKWPDYITKKARLSAERFSSLQPKHLIPIIKTLSERRGFRVYGVVESKKDHTLCLTSHSNLYQYGLEVVISPSPTEKGVFIFKVNFYSDNAVNLSLLEYMFMDELDQLVQDEEEKWPSALKEEPASPGGRYSRAEPTSVLRIPAPEWSEKEWVEIPVWMPEDKETPEYHPAGLPQDFRLYERYSDYYNDYFSPYPKRNKKKEGNGGPDKLLIEPGKGLIYLFEEPSPTRAFTLFKKMLDMDFQGLYITREYPKKVINKYGLDDVPYLWLTNVPEKNALRPTDTEKLRFAFKRHLKDEATSKVILLDGVEYLVTHNTFSSILKLLQAIGDMISMSKGTLLIPISPATFQEQERKLLEREADEIIY